MAQRQRGAELSVRGSEKASRCTGAGAFGQQRPGGLVLSSQASTAGAGRSQSSDAVRQRRHRWRQRNQVVTISLDLTPDTIDGLVRLDCLREAHRADPRAVAMAILVHIAVSVRLQEALARKEAVARPTAVTP